MNPSLTARHEIPGQRALGISVAVHLMLLLAITAIHLHPAQHTPRTVLHVTLHRQELARPLVAAVPSPAKSLADTPAAHQPAIIRPPVYTPPPAPVPVQHIAAAQPTLIAAAAATTQPAAVASSAPVAITASTTSAASTTSTNTATAPATTNYTAASADAAYLNNPQPPYPLLAQQRHQEGLVTLRVEVDASGTPRHVSVLASSRYSLLDEAAVAAVSLWRFSPAQRDGVAIADIVHVPVRFNLRG